MVFHSLILEGKQGIFTDELYHIGERIWDEAQKEMIEKLLRYEREEKILIITKEDREILHGFDYTQKSHLDSRENFVGFLEKMRKT